MVGGGHAGAMGVPQPREKAERDDSLLYTKNDGIVDAAGDAPDPAASAERIRQEQPEGASAVSPQVHGSGFRFGARQN